MDMTIYDFCCKAGGAADAMGIGWMTKDELNQAIPPAYTEWIGKSLMVHILNGNDS